MGGRAGRRGAAAHECRAAAEEVGVGGAAGGTDSGTDTADTSSAAPAGEADEALPESDEGLGSGAKAGEADAAEGGDVEAGAATASSDTPLGGSGANFNPGF